MQKGLSWLGCRRFRAQRCGDAVAGLLVEAVGVVDAEVAGKVAGVQARAGFQEGGVGEVPIPWSD
jgi:hypothetical protein